MPENGLSGRFERIEKKVDGFNRLDHCVTEGFSPLERRLDQVIDATSRPKAATRRRSRPSKRRR